MQIYINYIKYSHFVLTLTRCDLTSQSERTLHIVNKKLILGIVAVATVIIALLVMLLRANTQMAEMTEIFTEEKNNLVSDYEELYTEYTDLHTDNDSLSGLLEEQRERVSQLTEELQTLKASNARRIKELQTELTTLRTVMRSFIVQIDSLNTRNTELTKENNEMKGRLASVRRENATLQEQNATLNEKMNVAARLEAKNISVETLNYKDKQTSKIAKIAKIKVGFTLAKNVSAKVGMRNVYVRISRPDGQLLIHSKADTFRYEDSEINYSAHREVEYGGEDTSSYIVYSVDEGELMSGNYETELFADGERIGQTTSKL